jgi:hypothetical protein
MATSSHVSNVIKDMGGDWGTKRKNLESEKGNGRVIEFLITWLGLPEPVEGARGLQIPGRPGNTSVCMMLLVLFDIWMGCVEGY